MTRSRRLAIGALVVYATTATMGVGLATGAWRNERHRWVHHVGFVGATALVAATVVQGLLDAPARAVRIAPALVPLAVLPRVSTRSRRHPAIALTAAPWLVAAALPLDKE